MPATRGGSIPFATSDIHMKYKLKMEPGKVLEAAVKAVKRASSYTPNGSSLRGRGADPVAVPGGGC